MESIKGRLKMEFLHCNYFPAITGLIVGLHVLHASKSGANIVALFIVIPRARYQRNVC